MNLPSLYRVFAPPGGGGGELVAVFGETGGLDAAGMQQLATSSGAALNAFVTGQEAGALTLRCFTPGHERAEHAGAALAALQHLARQGAARWTVRMPGGALTARLDGGWWLDQGKPRARLHPLTEPALLYSGLGLEGTARQMVVVNLPLGVVGRPRPSLVVPVSRLRSLEALTPDYAQLRRLARPLGADTLMALAMEGEHLALRVFRPGEAREQQVTAGAAACAAAYLLAYDDSRRLHPVIQRRRQFTFSQDSAPGQASQLWAQLHEGHLWVGGDVRAVSA